MPKAVKKFTIQDGKEEGWWYITIGSMMGNICRTFRVWEDDEVVKMHTETKNYFKTEEDAQVALDAVMDTLKKTHAKMYA